MIVFVAVMSSLNSKFRTTLAECKQMNSTELMAKVADITADKLLYDHAVQIVSGCGRFLIGGLFFVL